MPRQRSASFFSDAPVFDRAEYGCVIGRAPSDKVVSSMLAQHLKAGNIRPHPPGPVRLRPQARQRRDLVGRPLPRDLPAAAGRRHRLALSARASGLRLFGELRPAGRGARLARGAGRRGVHLPVPQGAGTLPRGRPDHGRPPRPIGAGDHPRMHRRGPFRSVGSAPIGSSPASRAWATPRRPARPAGGWSTARTSLAYPPTLWTACRRWRPSRTALPWALSLAPAAWRPGGG